MLGIVYFIHNPACFIIYLLRLPALKWNISVGESVIAQLKRNVLNNWLIEGRELVTSSLQEHGAKRQMFRSIILVCSCFLISVSCVQTFLPHCLKRYIPYINYVHPLNTVK